MHLIFPSSSWISALQEEEQPASAAGTLDAAARAPWLWMRPGFEIAARPDFAAHWRLANWSFAEDSTPLSNTIEQSLFGVEVSTPVSGYVAG